MTDNIASNGSIDLFASFREPAWHNLGTVFTEEVTEYRRMLALSGLDNWDVREAPLDIPATFFMSDESGVDTEVPNVEWAVTPKAVIANIGNEVRVLGITGERYQIVQNEDAFSFLQSLHDGARWETAGAIKNGRVVFGTMAFERDFVLDAQGVGDVVKSYLMLYTSHDGSTGIGGGVTPVRVVCQNTLNAALGSIKQTFKIRHTKNAEERMKAEAVLWRTAHTYMDAFEKEAADLFAKKVSDKQFFGIVENFFPKPETDVRGSVKKWETRQSLFAQAWNGAPNAGIKGTGWGAFNALTEANQWGRKVQNTKAGQENFAAAGAGFDGPTNVFRTEALAAVKSL